MGSHFVDLKLQVRVTDDRGTLQTSKGHWQQGLACTSLCFPQVFLRGNRKRLRPFHFLYLRMCAETCNTIIQICFKHHKNCKCCPDHCKSLLMGSQISNITRWWLWFHFILCRWWWFGFDFVHAAGRGPEGVVGMRGASLQPKPNLFQSDHHPCHDMSCKKYNFIQDWRFYPHTDKSHRCSIGRISFSVFN